MSSENRANARIARYICNDWDKKRALLVKAGIPEARVQRVLVRHWMETSFGVPLALPPLLFSAN